MDNTDDVLQHLEIDLEIAYLGEILASHGVNPSSRLVFALWAWHDDRLRQVLCEGNVPDE